MENFILINGRAVHQLRPVEAKSTKFELRLDVHLPERPRQEPRSRSIGSIDTTDTSGEVCTVQEPATDDLTRVNHITITFSYAEGAYRYPSFAQGEMFWLM